MISQLMYQQTAVNYRANSPKDHATSTDVTHQQPSKSNTRTTDVPLEP